MAAGNCLLSSQSFIGSEPLSLAERLKHDPELWYALNGDEKCVITPVKPPPRFTAVYEWLQQKILSIQCPRNKMDKKAVNKATENLDLQTDTTLIGDIDLDNCHSRLSTRDRATEDGSEEDEILTESNAFTKLKETERRFQSDAVIELKEQDMNIDHDVTTELTDKEKMEINSASGFKGKKRKFQREKTKDSENDFDKLSTANKAKLHPGYDQTPSTPRHPSPALVSVFHSTPVRRTSSELFDTECTPITSRCLSQPVLSEEGERKEVKVKLATHQCPPLRRLSTNTQSALRHTIFSALDKVNILSWDKLIIYS